MKKKNKIIALTVAIVLIISIFVVGTVANAKNTSVQISINKTELHAGESATVTVKVSANYPVATASIPVFYDKTMVSVSNATATLVNYSVANVTTDKTAVDSSKVYANTGIDQSKYGFVLVSYIGSAGANVPESVENQTVLTFTITAKSSVSGDALIKCVTESAKTDENVKGMLYFGATTSGTTITSIPENVENISISSASTSVTITSGSADLVAKADMPTMIDSTNKYIYGITPGDSIEDYIKVNNGSFELVANALGYKNGTGAIVNVKNASGTVVDTYTVIIFGDVNGDGTITSADANLIANVTVGGNINGAANSFAADANADFTITSADANIIANVTVGGAITTNPYAK